MTMTITIDKQIVSSKVGAVKAAQPEAPKQEVAKAPESNVVHMHEKLMRPEVLLGSTYKIKTPLSEHAMYITINDIVLNEGTEHEQRRPFEIFINSKNMENYQWISALTRVISAVFRKGGDVTFLVDELLSVFDPKGGYFKKGGVFMPSLIAEIGAVIKNHMTQIGLIKSQLDEHQKAFIEKKKQEIAEKTGGTGLENAVICPSCHQKTAVYMGGCLTCTSCSASKCG